MSDSTKIERLKAWFFDLPGPIELGLSDIDALRSSELTPFQEGPSWEDWEALVRIRFPVRYFLTQTLPEWFRPIQFRIHDTHYWLKCHFVKRHRHHLLDLRAVDPVEKYSHGYLDPCHVMWLAGWAALRMWVEHEKPVDPATYLTAEEALEPHNVAQKASYDEAMALYRYWMVERGEEAKELERLYSEYREVKVQAVMDGSRAQYEQARDRWLAQNGLTESRAELMWKRLAEVRPYLWT